MSSRWFRDFPHETSGPTKYTPDHPLITPIQPGTPTDAVTPRNISHNLVHRGARGPYIIPGQEHDLYDPRGPNQWSRGCTRTAPSLLLNPVAQASMRVKVETRTRSMCATSYPTWAHELSSQVLFTSPTVSVRQVNLFSSAKVTWGA